MLTDMTKNDLTLEKIFDLVTQENGLTIIEEGQDKIASSQVYNLKLEKGDGITRLLYFDQISSIDCYDCSNEKYLNYGILKPYQSCQALFLDSQDLKLAKDLTKKIENAEERPVHRIFFRVNLSDFNEILAFLYLHIENN